jgi:hypothetical protein
LTFHLKNAKTFRLTQYYYFYFKHICLMHVTDMCQVIHINLIAQTFLYGICVYKKLTFCMAVYALRVDPVL